MGKNYKQIWYTYKQGLLDEFEDMCKEVIDIKSELDVVKYLPLHSTSLEERKKHKLAVSKLRGQACTNILTIIDRIDNTSTVANLSAIYERAFEVFGIKECDYYELPFNQFFEESRTYKDKWEELKSILGQIVKNTYINSLIHEDILKYSEDKVTIMDRIERSY